MLYYWVNVASNRNWRSNENVSTFITDTRGLRAPHHVEQLQDQAQSMLGEYDRQTYPSQQVRFGRLLLMLPSLQALSSKCIEQMFFRGTLDNIPMERLLSDMFKSA